jgi:hypothetical protein
VIFRTRLVAAVRKRILVALPGQAALKHHLLSFTGDAGRVTYGAILAEIRSPDLVLCMDFEHELRFMTGGAGVPCIRFFVTVRAWELPFISVVQPERMLAKFCGRPGRSFVAVRTVLSKCTGVDVRLGVAVSAVSRRALIDIRFVTVAARDDPVRFSQRIGASMLEGRHPVLPIVAVQTRAAVFAHMPGHIRRVFLLVTRNTVKRVIHVLILQVAGGAAERVPPIIGLVPGKTETGQRVMVYVLKRKPGDVGVLALVLGVTRGAVSRRDPAVQPLQVLPLAGNLNVTIGTRVLCQAVERDVAVSALAF